MNVDGEWDIKITTPMGAQQATLELATADGAVTGVGRAMGTAVDIADGSVDGDRLQFTMKVKKPMSMTLRFDVEVAADALAGKVKVGPFGQQDVTGSRRT
ncbi:MAG: hypothetical protein ACRCSN_18835 [Dermatophilaceae bacterium]